MTLRPVPDQGNANFFGDAERLIADAAAMAAEARGPAFDLTEFADSIVAGLTAETRAMRELREYGHGLSDPVDPAQNAEDEPPSVPCPRCHGTGRVRHSMKQKPLWWEVQELRCSYCRGAGRVLAEANS